MDEFVIMFDVLGENNDYVDAYLVLATSPASMDEVRWAWLKRRLSVAKCSTNAATSNCSYLSYCTIDTTVNPCVFTLNEEYETQVTSSTTNYETCCVL